MRLFTREDVLIVARMAVELGDADAALLKAEDTIVLSAPDHVLAGALSHPIRGRILEHMTDGNGDGISPRELATALGEPLGTVSYHVRYLHRTGLVSLVSTIPRRGAVEHFYTLVETGAHV